MDLRVDISNVRSLRARKQLNKPRYGDLGFLEDDILMLVRFIPKSVEDCLGFIDEEFRELVKLFYFIPGCGTYGDSCSGHTSRVSYDKHTCWFSDNRSQPGKKPIWASLGLALQPQMDHIPELIGLLHEHTKTDEDAGIFLQKEDVPQEEYERYEPGTDLRAHALGKANSGLDIILIEIRLGDNNLLSRRLDREYPNKSYQRSLAIRKFWDALTPKVVNYNNAHGFLRVAFGKSEFDPY